jgi:hypothetical protein
MKKARPPVDKLVFEILAGQFEEGQSKAAGLQGKLRKSRVQ